jgi:hypothetical protein
MGERLDPEMTAPALATAVGWSAAHAWRRMRAIERKHPGVIRRVYRADGKTRALVARTIDLASYIPELRKRTRFEDHIGILARRVSELEARLDAEVAARQAFQRESAEFLIAQKQKRNVAKEPSKSGVK